MTLPTFGLTGGIASGKSQALAYFAELGIPTCDTDQCAREVIAPGTPGEHALRAALGPEFFTTDGLDRGRLRNALFADPRLRQVVESIIHPRVRDAVSAWQNMPKQAPYQILCSPLLLETKPPALRGVIVVDVPESQQKSRGAQRDGTTPEAIEQIMAAQSDRATRLAKADFILDNSGSKDALRAQVQALHHKLKDSR